MKFDNQFKGKKILFGTAPADGHFNPLTGLAKYLQALGCDVRWYASPIFKDKLNKLDIPHYQFKKAKDINALNLLDMLPERQFLSDPAEKLDFDLIHVFGNRAPEYYEDIQQIHETFDFDLFIADSCFSAIPFVSKKMNIPVVSIGVIPLAENSVDVAPYGTALPPAANDMERAAYADIQKAMSAVVFKRSMDAYSAILSEYSIEHTRSLLFDTLIRQSDLYLQIGSQGFEYERSDLGVNVRFIGALLPYQGKKTNIPWFDQRLKTYRKVVLVTQGTVENDTTKIIQPTLEAFENTDTLVIATTGGNGTADLRKRFKSNNIIIEDFISFADVMPYADVYVTNGGYGGTLLSIHHELPMVAAGVHEGKNEVCARISHFNCGINLNTETPSSTEIRYAVEKVMTDKSYKTAVTHLSKTLNVSHADQQCAGLVIEMSGKKDLELALS